jgi:alpha-ketoglutarate-dependent taurine dioxygenase
VSEEPYDIPAVPRRRSLGGAWQCVTRTTGAAGLPCEITPAVDGIELSTWAAAARDEIAALLRQSGAILFRGFGIETVEQFESFIAATATGPMLEYSYRSTPRTRVHERIYTSTEYPPAQDIPLHNEMSYARRWPLKIWFFCQQPAEGGGATPIADSRRVFAGIHPDVRDRFSDKQVQYIRNYGRGLDLPVEEVFGESSREAIEARCREEQLTCEWLPDDALRTRQVCQASAIHPVTGDTVWFNQAHLFHPSSLPEDVRQTMVGMMGEDRLPRNACYGDGTPIGDADLETVRTAYRQATVDIAWRTGDVLLLDNMLTAHGRRSFTGARRILVGMAEPFPANKVAP